MSISKVKTLVRFVVPEVGGNLGTFFVHTAFFPVLPGFYVKYLSDCVSIMLFLDILELLMSLAVRQPLISYFPSRRKMNYRFAVIRSCNYDTILVLSREMGCSYGGCYIYVPPPIPTLWFYLSVFYGNGPIFKFSDYHLGLFEFCLIRVKKREASPSLAYLDYHSNMILRGEERFSEDNQSFCPTDKESSLFLNSLKDRSTPLAAYRCFSLRSFQHSFAVNSVVDAQMRERLRPKPTFNTIHSSKGASDSKVEVLNTVNAGICGGIAGLRVSKAPATKRVNSKSRWRCKRKNKQKLNKSENTLESVREILATMVSPYHVSKSGVALCYSEDSFYLFPTVRSSVGNEMIHLYTCLFWEVDTSPFLKN